MQKPHKKWFFSCCMVITAVSQLGTMAPDLSAAAGLVLLAVCHDIAWQWPVHQQWVFSDRFCGHTHDSSNVGMPQLHPLGNLVHGLQGKRNGLWRHTLLCVSGLVCCVKRLLLSSDVEAPNAASAPSACRCLQWDRSALQQSHSFSQSYC